MNNIERELALKAMNLAYHLSNEVKGRDTITTLVLGQAREAAATALTALIDVSPADVADVTRLQNEVKRYRDMMEWVQHAITQGTEAGLIVKEEDRQAIDGHAHGWRTEDEYDDEPTE